MNDSAVEQIIQDRSLTAPRLSPATIHAVIQSAQYHVFGKVLTVCVLTLENGFTVTGESACVSPENFDAELGRQIAHDHAKEKIWALEGYLLKERLYVGAKAEEISVTDVEWSNHKADMELAAIAKVAHEINRAYCQAIGDDSQDDWDESPQWQKDSAMNGVLLHLANPAAEASASHDNWRIEKVQNGWIYGPTKNGEAKTHPCMVDFAQLPVGQQAKDHLFRQTVNSLAGRWNFG